MSRTAQRFQHIAFVASQAREAREAYARLESRYGSADPAKADVIVALGGDGLMLQTLHKFMNSGKPIYGMHRGTVGFLMNEFSEEKLAERLVAAHITVIHPLVMRARDAQGRTHEHRAINEVSLFRQSAQAAHLRILIDGQERLAELVADGVLVATPAGSTAYNLSAQGADHSNQRAVARAHADQPFPASSLAWRAAAGQGESHDRSAWRRTSARLLRWPTTTKYARCVTSRSAWTTISRSICCSILATISTSAFCVSNLVSRSRRA